MQKILFLLLPLALLGPLGIDLYLPVIPLIAQGLGTSEPLIQSTIALFIGVMGIGQLITGPLVDYFGRRPIALVGVALYGSGALLAATANVPGLFVLSRVLQGLAVCCTTVAVSSFIRDRLNGEAAARAFSFLNGALNIVPALAPMAGALLATAFNWRAPFWVLAIYSLLVLLLLLFSLPETRPTRLPPSIGLFFVRYWNIASQRYFITFSLVNTGAMAMALTYVSLSSQILMRESTLSPLQFSLAFGSNGVWIMLVSIIANRVIRKAGRPLCLTLGMLLMAAGALMLVGIITLTPEQMQTHWLSYMIPVATACAGLAFLMGPATSYALEPYPEQAGVASALNGFLQMAGAAAINLLALSLPLAPRLTLALVMLLAATFAYAARLCSNHRTSHLNPAESLKSSLT